jgi:hypothetical protein
VAPGIARHPLPRSPHCFAWVTLPTRSNSSSSRFGPFSPEGRSTRATGARCSSSDAAYKLLEVSPFHGLLSVEELPGETSTRRTAQRRLARAGQREGAPPAPRPTPLPAGLTGAGGRSASIPLRTGTGVAGARVRLRGRACVKPENLGCGPGTSPRLPQPASRRSRRFRLGPLELRLRLRDGLNTERLRLASLVAPACHDRDAWRSRGLSFAERMVTLHTSSQAATGYSKTSASSLAAGALTLRDRLATHTGPAQGRICGCI